LVITIFCTFIKTNKKNFYENYFVRDIMERLKE
jgi:hypothetical protein